MKLILVTVYLAHCISVCSFQYIIGIRNSNEVFWIKKKLSSRPSVYFAHRATAQCGPATLPVLHVTCGYRFSSHASRTRKPWISLHRTWDFEVCENKIIFLCIYRDSFKIEFWGKRLEGVHRRVSYTFFVFICHHCPPQWWARCAESHGSSSKAETGFSMLCWFTWESGLCMFSAKM